MTGAEVLDRLSSLGVTVRLAKDGTLRLPRREAVRYPDLVEELRVHRAEAVEVLGLHPRAVHPCLRCGRESAPEDLFCQVECFDCWKAERAARRRNAGATP